MPPEENPPSAPGMRAPLNWGVIALLLALLLAGVALRIFAPPPYATGGHDEFLYMRFVQELNVAGISYYPAIVQDYNANQLKADPADPDVAKLPPTRFLYIFCASCWDQAFYHPTGDKDNTKESIADALLSLHAISCLFSILTLPLAALFAFRLGGARFSVGVLALVACSPMQIYVSRHALIDGFFAFWALLTLWLLWECLRNPGRLLWLAAYAVSIALMVLTKENAFFVFVAVCGILIVNRWAKFGTVNPALLIATFGGAALGALGIVLLAGGVGHAVETYKILVTQASHLAYAIRTGDGPWYRYLLELLIMSPLILLLAIGGVFNLRGENKPQIFLVCFVAFSYLVMCNVKYGMNLRYTNMWDMPLRYLAFWQIGLLCAHFGRHKTLALVCAMACLCIFDLRQYHLFFVEYGIYEPVPRDLLHAVKLMVY
ncbi:MAG TPA: phospholipid carrier-dependent glycosyltransferase [Chthoniobacteraceae bacterium]|nr:phospholipid carrier-dependent glycosyltransferase [Chthoniobacteraceae bacterium]